MSAERPAVQVTVKLATSLDGRIAAPSGQSQWITGEAARAQGQWLRANHHAVLVGSQTVLDDNPMLTVRVDDYKGPQPLRVVADARLRTPTDCRLVHSALPLDQASGYGDAEHAVTAVVTAIKPQDLRAWELSRRNVLVGFVQRDAVEGVSPRALLNEIAGFVSNPMERVSADEPVRVFIEGGARLVTSFVRAGLVDQIEWFRAPMLLGGHGRAAIDPLEFEGLDGAPRFRRMDVREVGDDLWETYERLPLQGEE